MEKGICCHAKNTGLIARGSQVADSIRTKTLKLSAEIHRKIDVASAHTGLSMYQLVEEAWSMYEGAVAPDGWDQAGRGQRTGPGGVRLLNSPEHRTNNGEGITENISGVPALVGQKGAIISPDQDHLVVEGERSKEAWLNQHKLLDTILNTRASYIRALAIRAVLIALAAPAPPGGVDDHDLAEIAALAKGIADAERLLDFNEEGSIQEALGFQGNPRRSRVQVPQYHEQGRSAGGRVGS